MIKMLMATSALMVIVGISPCAQAEVTIGDDFTIGGRVKQGVAVAYDKSLVGGGTEIGQMNYLVEVSTSWRPHNNVTVTGDFWLRGDWYSDLGGDLTAPGLQDYASPGFAGRFAYHLSERGAGRPGGPLPNPAHDPFGSSDRQNRFLSDFNDEVIHEAAVKFTDPENLYALKVGKFVRAWGQSDGIRLLDVLHAQDLRQKFILGDPDESRIASWMVAGDIDLARLGLGDAFEAVGIRVPKLELIYMPEYHHDQFIINNPTPGDATSGGLYGLPFPLLADKASGTGIPFVGAHLTDREPDRFDFQEPTLGARLKFEVLGGEATLNALYAYQELPIIKLAGATIVVGNALNDGGSAMVTVPLGSEITEAVVQGAYIPYLGSGSPTAEGAQAILGCPGGAGPLCSVNVQFDLDYRYRRKLIGASYTRDMAELPMGPKEITPVLRAEFTYEFDKPFNRSSAITMFGNEVEGSAALIVDPSRGVTERDQISFMIGADYFLWLPVWEGQDTSVFTSVQLFTVITPNGEDLLFQAPYAAYGAKLHPVQNYATILLGHNFDDGKLAVETLGLYDFQNQAWGVRQRVDFNYFGDNWRPRIEVTHFEAAPEQGIIGLGQQMDNVEFSLAFQF